MNGTKYTLIRSKVRTIERRAATTDTREGERWEKIFFLVSSYFILGYSPFCTISTFPISRRILGTKPTARNLSFSEQKSGQFYLQTSPSKLLLVVGHFRVTLCFGFKTSLRAKPFMHHIWKWVWFCMKMNEQVEDLFIWMVSYEDSFWNRGKKQLLQPYRQHCHVTLN